MSGKKAAAKRRRSSREDDSDGSDSGGEDLPSAKKRRVGHAAPSADADPSGETDVFVPEPASPSSFSSAPASRGSRPPGRLPGVGCDMYYETLLAMRRNESMVIDTRANFCYGLAKRGQLADSAAQWRKMQNRQGKLTNNFAQIDANSIQIKPPLTIVDIQPMRADGGNFRYLTRDEVEPKLRALPRTVVLGSSSSLASHPILGTAHNFRAEVFGHTFLSEKPTIKTKSKATSKKGDDDEGDRDDLKSKSGASAAAKKMTLSHEWIVWAMDGDRRVYPMTIATFAEIIRSGNSTPIVLDSASGWRMVSDEDRCFVVPSHYVPNTTAAEQQASTTSATAPAKTSSQTATMTSSQTAKITPAVGRSRAGPALLPEFLATSPTPTDSSYTSNAVASVVS